MTGTLKLGAVVAALALVVGGCGSSNPETWTLAVTAEPAVVLANGVSAGVLTATLTDSGGDPLAEQTITFAAEGQLVTITPASATTNAAGKVTAQVTTTVAQQVVVVADASGKSTQTAIAFVPGPVSTEQSALTATPSSLEADGVAQSAVTLKLADAFGNPIANSQATFSVTGAQNTLMPEAGVTGTDGTLTATLSSIVAEEKTVTATVKDLTFTTTVTFIPGGVSATESTFTAAPQMLIANGISKSVLTLTARDAQGNLIPSVPVTLTSSGTNDLFSPASGMTDASGVFTADFSSTRAEVKTVTATLGAGGVSLTADVTFNPGPPASGQTTLMAAPTTVIADGVQTATLTVTARDAQGNIVPNHWVQLGATGTQNVLQPSTGLTNANGVFTAQLRSSLVGTKVVTATVGGATATANVSFVPGPPSATTSTFTVSPTSVTANGTSPVTITFVARDAGGNTISGLPVTLSASGTANNFTVTSGTTNSTGGFTSALTSTKAEQKTISLDLGMGQVLTAQANFLPGPPSASMTTFSAAPATVVANGSSTTTLTVNAVDAFGNPVTGQTVSFSSTGSSNFFGAASGVTNAAGTFTTTLASATAQTKTITATVGPVTMTANVTFVPGPVSLAQSSVTANPGTVPADGVSQTTITVALRDANGNGIPNHAVSLSVTGTGNTLTPPGGNTNASGNFTATLASTVIETKTVTADANGVITLTTTVNFSPLPPSAATSTFTATPASTTADGTSAIALTVVVRDANNAIRPNEPVMLTSTGTSNTFTPASGMTDSTGTFTSQLTSTKAEAKTLTATFGGVSVTQNVTFLPGSPSGTTSTITANPSTVAADGVATTTLTVTARDANGNVVPGASVAITSTGTNNTFNPSTPNGTTGANGEFTATLASTTKETKTVSALVAGAFSVSTTVVFGDCKVLVLGDSDDVSTGVLVNALNGAGMTASTITHGIANYANTPAASGFNAIVVMNGNSYSLNMPSSGQSAIIAANTAGTGLVMTEWIAYSIQQGRFTQFSPVLLFSRSSGQSGPMTFNLTSAGHPIWAGLPTSFTANAGGNVGSTLTNGGVQIASCTSCGIGVAVKDVTGRIVQLAHAANYTKSSTFWTTETNLRLQMINAVKWAGRCQ